MPLDAYGWHVKSLSALGAELKVDGRHGSTLVALHLLVDVQVHAGTWSWGTDTGGSPYKGRRLSLSQTCTAIRTAVEITHHGIAAIGTVL